MKKQHKSELKRQLVRLKSNTTKHGIEKIASHDFSFSYILSKIYNCARRRHLTVASTNDVSSFQTKPRMAHCEFHLIFLDTMLHYNKRKAIKCV